MYFLFHSKPEEKNQELKANSNEERKKKYLKSQIKTFQCKFSTRKLSSVKTNTTERTVNSSKRSPTEKSRLSQDLEGSRLTLTLLA